MPTANIDIIGGRPLPNCPYEGSFLPPRNTSTTRYHNPAVSSTYHLYFVMFLVLAFLTIYKYNNVKIFNRTITDPSITNKEYFFSYLCLALGFLIDAIRYSLNLPFEKAVEITFRQPGKDQWVVGPYVMDAWLLITSGLLRSAGLLFLTLALNQQRIYRSSAAAHPLDMPSSSTEETTPLLAHNIVRNSRSNSYPGVGTNLLQSNWDTIPEIEPSSEAVSWKDYIMSQLFSMTTIITVIWVFRVAIMLLTIDSTRLGDTIGPGEFQSWPLFQSLASVIQMIPFWHLVFVIVKTPASTIQARPRQGSNRAFGPSIGSKFLLIFSCITTTIFWLEPSIVSRMIETLNGHAFNESACIVPPFWWVDRDVAIFGHDKIVIPAHGWASSLDIMQWFGGFGLYAIFYFMKIEYTRNMEDWVWITVSEVQNTFDFRRY